MMRRFRALVILWTVALVLTQTWAGTALGAPADSSPGCSTQSTPPSDVRADAHPVVLVHGWRGSPLQDTAKALTRELGEGWQFLLFDYQSTNRTWAASDEVAGCLADYLQMVSLAHQAAGGDALVYTVAHSMGGLAVRFAVQRRPELADRVGGLITLDTPHRGSPWGNSGVYALLADWFGQSPWSKPLPKPADLASRCLAPHDAGGGLPDGCLPPPYLPASIPVHQVDGSATVVRTFFGVRAYALPLGGDGIVPSASSAGYAGSAQGTVADADVSAETISCQANWEALRLQPSVLSVHSLTGLVAQLALDRMAMDAVAEGRSDPALIELVAVALLFMPCSHVGIIVMPEAIRSAADALRKQAQDHAPTPTPTQVDSVDWLTRDYVVTCAGIADQPFDATVAEGRGEGPPDSQNTDGFDVRIGDPQIGDLTGDGVLEVAVPIVCAPKGASPNFYTVEVQIFTRGPELLASLQPPSTSNSSELGFPPRFNLSPFAVTENAALETGADYWVGQDAHCCPSVSSTVTWRWNGQTFVPTESLPGGEPGTGGSPPVPSPPPDAPSDVHVDSFYGTLQWTDMSDNEDGFRIYHNGTLVGTEPADSTQFHGTLVGACTDTLTVSSFNSNGESPADPIGYCP